MRQLEKYRTIYYTINCLSNLTEVPRTKNSRTGTVFLDIFFFPNYGEKTLRGRNGLNVYGRWCSSSPSHLSTNRRNSFVRDCFTMLLSLLLSPGPIFSQSDNLTYWRVAQGTFPVSLPSESPQMDFMSSTVISS